MLVALHAAFLSLPPDAALDWMYCIRLGLRALVKWNAPTFKVRPSGEVDDIVGIVLDGASDQPLEEDHIRADAIVAEGVDTLGLPHATDFPNAPYS